MDRQAQAGRHASETAGTIRALLPRPENSGPNPAGGNLARTVDEFIAACMTVGRANRTDWNAPSTLVCVLTAASLAGRHGPRDLPARIDRACAYAAATGQSDGRGVYRAFCDPANRRSASRLATIVASIEFLILRDLVEDVVAVGRSCGTKKNNAIVEVDAGRAPPGYEVSCPVRADSIREIVVRRPDSRVFVFNPYRKWFVEAVCAAAPSVDEVAVACSLSKWNSAAGWMCRRIAAVPGTQNSGVSDLKEAFAGRPGGLGAWAFLDSVTAAMWLAAKEVDQDARPVNRRVNRV